jgi:hypothetical protein
VNTLVALRSTRARIGAGFAIQNSNIPEPSYTSAFSRCDAPELCKILRLEKSEGEQPGT